MKSKISLCMIVGNVEEYIERCLESFKDACDEIVLVRAIGGQKPDKTIDLAMAKFSGRLVIGEYKNKTGHEDWPHIDDFAAARQLSFDLSGGEYCLWADSDDVLVDGSAALIREHAERGGYPCYLFNYDIFARGVVLPRERMMLKGAGKWVDPVHEHFEFTVDRPQSVRDERVVVRHMPHFTGPLTKTGSHERNMRILSNVPEDTLSGSLLYHLHGEYIAAGNIPKAIEIAKKALSHTDLGRPEKYEIFLNLARSTKKPNEISAFLHEAYKTDPRRAEALALLTCNCLDYCMNDDALAYAGQLMATKRPKDPAWNSRDGTYTWLGADVYSQALRVNGRMDEAEAIRKQSFASAGGARISLIHATKGRPQQASMTRKLWLDLAEKPEQVEHLFVFDSDDEESLPLARMPHVVAPAGGGCVRAWNLGAFCSCSDVVIQLSDDWTPPPLWDKLILERIGDTKKPAVLAISDGVRTDDLLCMAICTRAYWAQDCFLFHPDFTGVYSDNWFTDSAYARGVVINAKDLVFQHSHPAFGSAQPDKIYLEQNAPGRYIEGKAVYDKLKEGGDWSSCHGWFDYWLFYMEVANKIKDGESIAEVGVWMGRSIIFMAQQLKRQGKKVKIYAVDTFQGEKGEQEHSARIKDAGGSLRAVFDQNIKRCGVDDMIEIVEGDSAESAAKIADDSLAFVFIDAAHDYNSVKRDLRAWQPKLVKDGIFAGHDARSPAVHQAVQEVIKKPAFTGNLWISNANFV